MHPGKDKVVLLYSGVVVCVVLYVFFPFILDIKFVGRTSRGHTGGRSHRISHPPSFCGACLDFLARRIQPFLSLVDCEIEFCVLPNDSIVLHPLGIFSLFFSFLVRKIPFAGIELTSQRVRGLRGTSELPGRPALGRRNNKWTYKNAWRAMSGRLIHGCHGCHGCFAYQVWRF